MSTTTPDRIRLSGLSARGYHGVLPFERAEGQLFTVDVTLDLGERGTAVASVTDEAKDATDYSAVARAVVAVIEGEPVGLIETLAARVSEAVLAFPRVSAVEVTVHKPQAPLDVAFDDVSVTIRRAGEDAAPSVGRAQAAAPAEDAAAAAAGLAVPAASALDGPEAGEDRSAPAAAASPAPAESWTGAQAGATPDAAAPPQMPAQPPVDVLTQHPAEPVGLVIALGGNVGGVVPALRAAVRTLRETDGITVTTVAPLARTAAVVEPGSPEQPDYLNTVVLAQTTLSPREVLAVCQGLEADAGRVRTEPKGPRTLDADIITYGGVTSDAADLTLPHPNAARRAFVLAPWAQADPFAEIGDQYVASLVESAPDREGVRWLALDWLDSDHLPALPTGQYVAPPEAGEDQPDQPTGAGASEPGGLDGAAGAPADEGLPADAGPGDPSAGNGQRPAGPVAGAGQTPVASEPDRESGQEPTTHQQTGAPPAGSAPHASSAPRAGAQGEPWSSPLEWNDVIGRNGQGR